MADTVDLILDAFNGGEFSPRAQGRLTLPAYKRGAKSIENLIPLVAGGLERCPGTEIIAEATGAEGSDSSTFTSDGSWLIPFRISTGSSYVIELSDYKMRFFRDRGALLHSHAEFGDAEINLNANQFEIEGHGFHHGQQVVFHVNPGGVAPSGLVDQTVYTVCLPEALRSKDPVGPDYESFAADVGFELRPEMGPYEVRHSDPNDSPVGKRLWVHTRSGAGTKASFAEYKGGTEINPAVTGQNMSTIVPWPEAQMNTFRVSTNFGTPTKDHIRTATVSIADKGTGGGYFEAMPETASGDDPPVELDTPWSYDQLKTLQFTSDGDEMYFSSGCDCPIYKLSRWGTSAFRLDRTQFIGGPLGPEAPLGDQTEVSLSIPDQPVAGTLARITCDSSAFRGTDVGLPFRKTFNGMEGTQEQGLKHCDMVIKRLEDDYAAFLVEESVSLGSVSGTMTLDASHPFGGGDPVWLWPKDDPDYVFPPELETYRRYWLGQTAPNTFIILNDPLDVVGIPYSDEVGMRVVGAELTSVSISDPGVPTAHGYEDGQHWCGIWSDGRPPGGLDVGVAYRVENNSVFKFSLLTDHDTYAPIRDMGEGLHTINGSKNSSTELVREAKGYLIRSLTNANAKTYAQTSSERWRIGVLGAYNGWPGALSIHDERLIMGGSFSKPMTVWGSQLGAPTNFLPDTRTGTSDSPSDATRTITETSAWSYILDRDDNERILWLRAGASLVAGSVGPLHIISGLTPGTVSAVLMTSRGASSVRPVISDAQMIWGTSNHNRIYAAGYREERQGYIPKDISELADHYFTRTNPLVQMALQENPWSLNWLINEEGLLVCCTYDLEESVNAWAQRPVGGTRSKLVMDRSTGQLEDTVFDRADVKSICTIPSADGTNDDLWMVVERQDGTSTDPDEYFRTIEVMAPRFDLDDPQEDAIFVDASVSAEVAPGTGTFVVPDVLREKPLDLWVDGVKQAQQTSDVAGEITLATAAEYKIVVGIPAPWRWHSLSLASLISDQPTYSGVQGTVSTALAYLFRSLGGRIGVPNEMQDIEYTDAETQQSGVGPALFTGLDEIEVFPDSPDRDSSILLESNGPEPFFLTHLILRLTGGRDTR